MGTPAIEISTARLRLRQWQDSDYEPFARMNADERVMEFFVSPLERDASNALADKSRAAIRDQGWGLWAVEVVGVAPFIGFVGLNTVADSIPIAPCVEVGWRLDRRFWGYGYASEAATAAVAFGFASAHLSEIVSFTATINHRSRKVMERIGMRFNGETFEHPNVPKNHPLREHVVYRISPQPEMK